MKNIYGYPLSSMVLLPDMDVKDFLNAIDTARQEQRRQNQKVNLFAYMSPDYWQKFSVEMHETTELVYDRFQPIPTRASSRGLMGYLFGDVPIFSDVCRMASQHLTDFTACGFGTEITHRMRAVMDDRDSVDIADINIIFAMDKNGGIGLNGELPWDIPEDLAQFKKHTQGCAIIQGFNTAKSIGRVLPGRECITVSERLNSAPIEQEWLPALRASNHVFGKMEEAYEFAAINGLKIWVIGGAGLIETALKCSREVFVSFIKGEYETDVKVPKAVTDLFRYSNPVRVERFKRFDLCVFKGLY